MNIKLEKIKKTFNGREVLNIDGLGFESGKIYAVLGPNGSGKTTMVRIIEGIEKPDCGNIYYDGEKCINKGQLAFLPQKPYIFDMSVLKNIMISLTKEEDCENKVFEALKMVGLDGFSAAKARTLSGGEMQRVAVARTFVLGKKAFILDEPATSIDIASMNLVENCIREASRKNNSTVIFTTHSPSQAIRTAHEAIFLWGGRVLERGIPEELVMNPIEPETKEFMKNWRV